MREISALALLIAVLTAGCSVNTYSDEKLDHNFVVIDKAIKDIATVLKAHDERLEILYPTKKEAKK